MDDECTNITAIANRDNVQTKRAMRWWQTRFINAG